MLANSSSNAVAVALPGGGEAGYVLRAILDHLGLLTERDVLPRMAKTPSFAAAERREVSAINRATLQDVFHACRHRASGERFVVDDAWSADATLAQRAHVS